MLTYLAAMSVTAGLYALMALGVNLTWGMTGMVNLGLAGFFAVGGYTTALLTKSGVPSRWACSPAVPRPRRPVRWSRWSRLVCAPTIWRSLLWVFRNQSVSPPVTRSG
jgi:ABC-type branched-subunit amino acid transport system permease subunit